MNVIIPIILLIHGLDSNHTAWDDFTSHANQKPEFCYNGNWHTEDKGQTFFEDSEHCEAGPHLIYSMDFSSPNELTFNEQGEEVRRVVENILFKHQDREVLLVGHSMGGLAARAYIMNNPQAPVSGLITIGTPHGGSYLGYTKDWLNETDNSYVGAIEKEITSVLSGINLRSPALDYLKPNSIEMQELRSQIFPKNLPVVLVMSNWEPVIGQILKMHINDKIRKFKTDFINSCPINVPPLDLFSEKLQEKYTDGVVTLPAQDIRLGVANPADIDIEIMNPMSVFHAEELKEVAVIEQSIYRILSMIDIEDLIKPSQDEEKDRKYFMITINHWGLIDRFSESVRFSRDDEAKLLEFANDIHSVVKSIEIKVAVEKLREGVLYQKLFLNNKKNEMNERWGRVWRLPGSFTNQYLSFGKISEVEAENLKAHPVYKEAYLGLREIKPDNQNNE